MIRELHENDAAALTAFFEENDRPEVTGHFHPFPLTAATAAKICEEPHRDRYFAVFFEKEIRGFGMLRGWDEGFAVPSFGVMVDHRSHGRGLGRELTSHALALAREMQCTRVRLTVNDANVWAVRLYEQMGFRKVEALSGERWLMFAEL